MKRGEAANPVGAGPGPSPADAGYQNALRQFSAGRQLKATRACEQVLAHYPDHADTLHLLGLIALKEGQRDAAVAWISRALRVEAKADYLSTLGEVLQQQGRHEDALKAFDGAVQRRPDDAAAWRRLADALAGTNRSDDAQRSYQQVLELNPKDWDAAERRGNLLHRLGRFEEALACFEICEALRPRHLPALYMRTVCLCALRRFDEALTVSLRARDAAPNNADMCNNVGAVLQSLGRDDEAVGYFDQAIKRRADFRDALSNKAASLTKLRRIDEALAIYRRLVATNPADAQAALGIAHIDILTGNFTQGWAGREHRWRLPATYPRFTQPMWLGGEPLAGRTILIGADEGLGDTLQFVRYVPVVAAMGARVVLVVQDALHPLLTGLDSVAECIPITASGTLPAFDVHTPLTSLVHALGSTLETLPAPASYIRAPAERVAAWEERLGPHRRLRVGLVWSGNPRHKNDHNRSMPLAALLPLLDVDAAFISLQKDPRPMDRAVLDARNDILDWTADFVDFADTAALVSCLDLVITVDTSVAHLAGALGRPTWLLLPFVPDYRWMLDREDCPWYPTMRLFRQDASRTWDNVVARVRNELGGEVGKAAR